MTKPYLAHRETMAQNFSNKPFNHLLFGKRTFYKRSIQRDNV